MGIIKLILQLNPYILLGCALGIIIFLVFYLLSKLQKIKLLNDNISQLYRELQELDNQAKLIIQSDMELKLYQEDVEDKLKKLTLLRTLISSSISILDEEELFSKIDEELINNLGFKKSLLILYPTKETKLNINFTSSQIEGFKDLITHSFELIKTSSVTSYKTFVHKEELKESLGEIVNQDFLLAPIRMGKNIYGIFILANCILPRGVTAAEEEIFYIICMYLGQCLDNIKLFESLYKASEELESKVKEKTFQLKKSLDEIKAISKLKSEFISGVSHELRTPLTSIKGFSSLLVAEKFGTLPEEAKERLKKIDTNVDKLVNMVNTLLDISRIESKKVEIKITPTNIVKIIKDVKDFFMPQVNSKNINLVLNTPNYLDVYADNNLIERVFINIINNAIKFTPQGGTITVGCTPKDTHALISVSDTGCGMTKVDCEKIFQEFYRADNALNKKVQGTGLGLSLVKKIIDTHGENIWVESELNKGTTFYFTLKLVK